MKNKKKIILALITSVILLAAFYGVYSKKNNKEMEFFYGKFGARLPKETKILFSYESYGAMGDGYRLYIYQISSGNIKNLVGKGPLNNWFELPLPLDFRTSFLKKIKGLTDAETARLIQLEGTRGYYTIRNNQTNRLITGTDVFDTNYNNVLIGIMNIESNKIYVFSYDM